MPFKRQGKTIYVKRAKGWVKKQVCGSVNKAKAALRILREKTGH